QPEAVAPDFPPRVGKYEILGRLGSGAMGVVYHARDPLLERDVALKVMLAQIARDPEQKHRFEREARAVARMMHPNVVTVFDLGYHADGSPYIAMEFLSGNDLFHMMRATPPLSLERKVSIVVSVLEGLAHAHKVGIVHRDIKPANVFLTNEGGVKIMDFGVARFAMGNITGTGMVVGTAEYMSPEQVRGEVVDGRSDVFSAGAMLYELVRGSRPFHADGIMAIFYKITHEDPAFDFPFTPEYRALIPILGKALAKDAAARYQSASEFADALRPFIMAPGMRPTAVVVPLPAVPAAPIPARVQEEVPPTSALPPPVPAIIDDRRTIVDPSPLFQLIREIYVGGRTGHLHFTRAKEWRSLRFLKGQILHATSDVEGEHLGDVLVRYGLLTQDDLEKARTVVLAERKKLGTVLDSMGLMPKGELESSIKLHVREVLFNVTEMPDMKFSFEELGEDSFLETELQSRVAPGEMILEAARRIQEPAVVTAVLGNIDRVIAPASHPVLGAQKLTLTPTDGFVLSRVDGTLTAREVFHLTPLPAEDTERSLFALLCTGAVEYRAPVPRPRTGVRIAEPASSPGTASHKAPPTGPPPPAPAPPPPAPATAPANAPATPPAAAATPSPPPAPKTDAAPSEAGRRAMADARRREIQELHDGMRSKDHFEILGISRSATADEVKDAYFRLARPYHPDASLDPSLEDLRDKRSAVFIRLGEAYETLRNPTSRKRYETAFPPRLGVPRPEPSAAAAPPPRRPDPALDEKMAAQDFAKAQRLMGEEKYWDAIQLLEEAIPRLEATAGRRARVMLARAYMKNPKWRHRAEEVLGEVVREAPDAPEPYLVLGELYRGAQLRARAAAMYRKALQLSPRNEEALNALRAIDAEDRPPGGDSASGNKARKR
ncbi:MAG TPA: protein kinase, partial [Vicinamibacteria bacterium]|nr:protein kinase [Vicinamibacteria bacterium]